MSISLFPTLSLDVEVSMKTSDLMEMYKKGMKYSNFSIGKLLNEKQSQVYQILFENIRLSRAICLTRLCQMDDFEFFDSPSLQEMFECAIAAPSKMRSHFNPLISQSLLEVVNDIYKHHESFAEKIIKHCPADQILH